MIKILLPLLLCFPLLAGAQCGFDELNRIRMLQDTTYAAAFQEILSAWTAVHSASNNQRMIIKGKDTTYRIPVVFHVFHNGEAIGSVYNPSDAQLVALVDYVNASFNASWAGYPSPATGGVRTGIEFALATVDSNCNSTSGINRVNTSAVPGYGQYGAHYPGGTGPGVDDSIFKKLSCWNVNEYLNIYVVNRIDENGVGGFATYPYSPPSSKVACLYMVSSSANAGNSLLVHELGHYFGLRHTFEGDNNGTTCPPLSPCNNSGDFICDTEPDKRKPNCAATTNACTGAAYKSIQFNFMNYSACTDRFTAGQREWMLMYIKSPGYWGPLAHSHTGDTLTSQPAMVPATCKTTFLSPSYLISAIYGLTLVSFNGIYRASQHTREEGKGAYVDNTCLYRTTATAGVTYPFTVRIWQPVQDVFVFLDLNNDGQFQLPAEQLLKLKVTTRTDVISSITIPKTGVVFNKPLRMRVVADSVGLAGTGPCGALKYGQAEDYAVTVVPAAASAVAEAALGVKANVYPNPVHDILHLSFDKTFEGTASLYNILGQAVYEERIKQTTGHNIRTVEFPQGVYTLMIRDASGGLSMQKVCIQH